VGRGIRDLLMIWQQELRLDGPKDVIGQRGGLRAQVQLRLPKKKRIVRTAHSIHSGNIKVEFRQHTMGST
jgi:hypothetical protein